MVKRLAKIEISEKAISEYDWNRRIVTIPKESIENISLKYGFSEERPVISIIIGLVTLLLGIIFGLMPISKILILLFSGEQVHGNFGIYAFSMPLLLIGLWFVLKTFKYEHFLKVTTTTTTRKLSFGKRIERPAITGFIKECNRNLGYDILCIIK